MHNYTQMAEQNRTRSSLIGLEQNLRKECCYILIHSCFARKIFSNIISDHLSEGNFPMITNIQIVIV